MSALGKSDVISYGRFLFLRNIKAKVNPIKNALKSLSITSTNILVALIFFLFTAKISSPEFFGKVAVIQLLEVVTSTFFYFVPGQIITREVSYLYAKNELRKDVIEKFFTMPFLALPFFLVFLTYPGYVKLAIPYLFLYLLNSVMNSIMTGMDMFTESAISGNIFLVIRWVVSIIAVLKQSIYLFVLIWLAGGVVAVTMNYAFMARRIGLFLPSFDIPFILKHFRAGLPLYLSSAAGFFSSQGDRVTTAYLLGSYDLGIYQFSALVAGVPSMVLGTLTSVLLPTASFYKALGKDERKMASISFRLLSLLTFLAVIVSIPVGDAVILRFFSEYASGLRAFDLLLMATTLPYFLSSLTIFIVATKKDLRPFFVLSLINGGLVVSTSYLLIPRLGIIGGAISQLIVSVGSSIFTIYYAIRTRIFSIGRREAVVLILTPVVGLGLFFNTPLTDIIVLTLVVLAFKLFKIISEDEIRVVDMFLPSKLKFISAVLRSLA